LEILMSTVLSHPLPEAATTPRVRYRRLANRLLALAGLAMVLGVYVAYPAAHRFPFGVQLMAHLAIPVAAGVVKLGYVMRLATRPMGAVDA